MNSLSAKKYWKNDGQGSSTINIRLYIRPVAHAHQRLIIDAIMKQLKGFEKYFACWYLG
jgi:hypothetical protein